MSGRPAPLAGIKVLDLTRLLPGPLATRHLADLGAEVIKIEDPGGGDYARSMGAMHGERSFFFELCNRNKKSLCLDLKADEGRALLLRLAARADVVVEGFRPGVMTRLGLDHAALAKVNPRIVLCSISGYGQTGPYAQKAGHDINYIGYAGVLEQTGVVGGPPALSNLQTGDLLGGTMTAVFGVLAAIIDARANGRGRHVDVSMTDAVLAHAIFPMQEVLAHGSVRPRGEDLLTGGVPCYGVYRAADGKHLAVGALEEKFWHRLCEALLRPDLKPAHLATGEQGASARAALERIFATRTRDEWVRFFEPFDCCVSPVLSMEESLEDPQVVARGMVTGSGEDRCFAPPLRMSDFDPGPAREAPAAGQHREEILGGLGIDRDEIEKLHARGIC